LGARALSNTMRAIVKVKEGPGGTKVKPVPVPKIGPNEVLIRVDMAGICGTDLHIYEWDPWAQGRIKVPLIYGHEFAGTVDKVGGSVEGVARGDFVSAEGHLVCWRCNACRTGNAHVCENLKVLGVDVPGIFAEYVALPATNVIHNDKRIPLRVAAVQDPLGNAVHTAFSGRPTGHTAAVLGCGPIGLMAVAVAKAAGARAIVAVEKNEYRQALARKMGATAVYADGDEALREVKAMTGGAGAEDVYEMSGHPRLLDLALKMVQPAGGIHILGIYRDAAVPININEVVFRGLHVHGIHGRRVFDTWTRMQGMLVSGKLDIEPVFTHDYPFEKFDEAMHTMASGNCGKVTLHW
jgi:threonine 3-dehydrogenase